MLGHRTLNVEDYVAILRRRWLLLIVPALLFPLIGYLITFLYSGPRNSCKRAVSITVLEVMYGATSGGMVEMRSFHKSCSTSLNNCSDGTRTSFAFATRTHCSYVSASPRPA